VYFISCIFLVIELTGLSEITEGPILDGFIYEPPTGSTQLDCFALLTVSNASDLDAFLSNGYPTPEISMLLEDESIPEEDRYWLDCRLRSSIAQILHRFYDRNGNVIEIEADWIKPGEDYWQEIMMVNLPGEPEEDSPHWPGFGFPVESGPIYNLYGDERGHIAALREHVRLSRDGSIAVVQAGRRGRGGAGDMSFCFMYPDGSFREAEFPDTGILSDRNQIISQDGSISVWQVFRRNDPGHSSLLLYDRSGNELDRFELPVNRIDGMAISCDNRYIACSGGVYSGSGIIDIQSGDIVWFSEGTARRPFFTQNATLCVLPECRLEGNSTIVNLVDDYTHGIDNRMTLPEDPRNSGRNISISNDGRMLVIGGQVYLDGRNVVSSTELDYRNNSLSPNGMFGILYDNPSHTGALGVFNKFAVLDLSTIAEEDE